ncbi:TPA: hypothetical protein ACJMKL_003811 [Bacillus luti]
MKCFEVTELYVSKLDSEVSYDHAQLKVDEENTSKWYIEIRNPKEIDFLEDAASTAEELQIMFSVVGRKEMRGVTRVIFVQIEDYYCHVTLGGISQMIKK